MLTKRVIQKLSYSFDLWIITNKWRGRAKVWKIKLKFSRKSTLISCQLLHAPVDGPWGHFDRVFNLSPNILWSVLICLFSDRVWHWPSTFVYGKITSHHKFPDLNMGNSKRARSFLLSLGKKVGLIIPRVKHIQIKQQITRHLSKVYSFGNIAWD